MKRSMIFLAALALAFAGPPASAQIVPPDDSGALQCAVDGSTVYLHWEIYFFAPIQGYILERDGVEIATLDPGAQDYKDLGVPPGEHVYALSAINWNGSIGVVGRCAVAVQDSGLRCKVEGRVVHLEWGPILIDVYIEKFEIYRNGDLIAVLPGNTFPLAYDDTVPTVGKYGYKVVAVTSPSLAFPIGACEVLVECFNLWASVSGLQVALEWKSPFLDPSNPGPIPIDAVYHIVRDGEAVGDTPETRFVDKVPAPGVYLYEVWFDLGTREAPVRLIAACFVEVPPGNVLPPPKDLTCLVGRYPDRIPPDWNVDVTIPPPLDTVVLVWLNPIAYDTIVILRDGAQYAKLPGTRDWFLDFNVPPGSHVYAVYGILGNQRSPAVRCEVVVPGTLPFPPKDLQCIVLRLDDPVPLPQGSDPSVIVDPFAAVAISWVNGDDYDLILISRDGSLIAELPGGPAGEARRFVDRAPPPGAHTYCVVGASKLGKSRPACCKVLVPGPLPPPQELLCLVVLDEPIPCIDPSDPTVGCIPGSDGMTFPTAFVLLQWRNPVVYDKIVILRNGMTIASIAGSETIYRDPVVGGGVFTYDVIGIAGGLKSDPASCTVEVPPVVVPPPQDFTCRLLDIILKPDDPDIEANGLSVTPGDLAPFDAVILQWWNPIRYAGLVIIRDKVEIAKLPGDAMMYRDFAPGQGWHLYGIYGVLEDGRRSEIATCEIFVGPPVPPVENLNCWINWDTDPSSVGLSWTAGAKYDGIAIHRNGEPIAELPGDAMGYRDAGLAPGVYLYEVFGFIGNLRSPPASCQVIIEGPPQGNLLYFSSGIRAVPEQLADDIPIPGPGNRIACLASNEDDVQGWSFGVQSDPKFIVPAKYDLENTATAKFHGGQGPGFLLVDLLPDGVVMAVVIETGMDPDGAYETLPPGAGHALLNIEYAAGPSGFEGDVYPVRYSDALGDPPVQVLFVVKGFEVRPATLPGWVSLPGLRFIRGDVDGNGRLEVTDPINLLEWLFKGGDKPKCLQACDANGTGNVNIADPVYLFQFMFIGGPEPPYPFPDCGEASAPLGCDDPGSCK